MAGLTYTRFRPGDFCYIVVYTPMPPDNQLGVEFLEGMVEKVNHAPRVMPPGHPIWSYLQEPPKFIQSIKAKVIDPKAAQRHPQDPIYLNQEPGRDYLVVHSTEYARYLNRMVEWMRQENFFQAQRIKNLETAWNEPLKVLKKLSHF